MAENNLENRVNNSQIEISFTEDTLPPLKKARKQFERTYLERLMTITNGNVTQAFRIAELSRFGLYKLLQKYGVDCKDYLLGIRDNDVGPQNVMKDILSFILFKKMPIPNYKIPLDFSQVDKIIELGAKPISREALARCVETQRYFDDSTLTDKIRDDGSFDFVLCSGDSTLTQRVAFFRVDVKPDKNIPLYETYCGNVITLALKSLNYGKNVEDYSFPSIIYPRI